MRCPWRSCWRRSLSANRPFSVEVSRRPLSKKQISKHENTTFVSKNTNLRSGFREHPAQIVHPMPWQQLAHEPHLIIENTSNSWNRASNPIFQWDSKDHWLLSSSFRTHPAHIVQDMPLKQLAHGRSHLISWNTRNRSNLQHTDFSVPESKEHVFWKNTMSPRVENILSLCCDNINHLSRLRAHPHGEQIVHLMIWKQLTHGPHLMIFETGVSPETSSVAALWKEIKWDRLSK